jgi:hypothetical protein
MRLVHLIIAVILMVAIHQVAQILSLSGNFLVAHRSSGYFERAENHSSFTLQQHSAPRVQVFVVMTPAHGEYWERFYVNSIGWHSRFPDLKAYTFDEVPPASALARIIERMEMYDFEKSERHSNLLLAAFQNVYQFNNKSDWYLLAEDDTIVVKDNLDRLLDYLDANGRSQKETLHGKCVYMSPSNKHKQINFVVGGGGILMSRILLEALSRYVDECRKKYQKNILYGDARIGACLQHTMNRSIGTFDLCSPRPYIFSSMEPLKALGEEVKPSTMNHFVVTMHSKKVEVLRKLNLAIVNLTLHNRSVTFNTLRPYIDPNGAL